LLLEREAVDLERAGLLLHVGGVQNLLNLLVDAFVVHGQQLRLDCTFLVQQLVLLLLVGREQLRFARFALLEVSEVELEFHAV